MQGPAWLSGPKIEAPGLLAAQEVPEEVLAERRVEISSAAAATISDSEGLLIDREFGSWRKTVQVTTYVLRFVRRCSGQEVPKEELIGGAEANVAEKVRLSLRASEFQTVRENIQNIQQ